ncbi:MAG TPA: hypothetical protein VF139_04285 [Candidatus Polarisedimenticolaceae bacterium]
MHLADAQREMRARYAGGFYAQLVSGVLWLLAAALATWGTPRTAIATIVVGGFFIFPLTEALVRLTGGRTRISPENGLRGLGMQVAFVLPLSMPLLLPVGLHRLHWFFPALTILLGAHYLPFVTLYGMRAFAVLAAALVAGGVAIALYASSSFGIAAWFTGAVLLVFSAILGAAARGDRG